MKPLQDNEIVGKMRPTVAERLTNSRPTLGIDLRHLKIGRFGVSVNPNSGATLLCFVG